LLPVASPERAARLSGVHYTTGDLARFCLAGIQAEDFLLVEGAGGFYSPIATDGLNADLAEALGLPVLLVAPDRLGVVGHVLLTLEAAQRRGIEVVAVLLNRRAGACDPDLDNAQDLVARMGSEVPVVAGDVERVVETLLQKWPER
jgi:dethiobiotin synthetase